MDNQLASKAAELIKSYIDAKNAAIYRLLACAVLLMVFISLGNLQATNITFDKNPVLISDSLKTINAKQLASSSLDKLSENIYFSSLNTYSFLLWIFQQRLYVKDGTKFSEVLALNAFYNGKGYKAVEMLTTVFNSTTDSLRKAKICLNLIKISYLNNQLTEAMSFVKRAKDTFLRFYSYKQKYQLVFTEAKIALSQGLTGRAENLIIAQALPMSNKVKGRHNEFDCYLFLGKIYLKARQLTQAKWFFLQANTIAVNQDDVDGKIETSLLLAKTKIKAGDRAVALQDLANARKLICKNSFYLADLESLTGQAKR